jgi:hypothetical protein
MSRTEAALPCCASVLLSPAAALPPPLPPPPLPPPPLHPPTRLCPTTACRKKCTACSPPLESWSTQRTRHRYRNTSSRQQQQQQQQQQRGPTSRHPHLRTCRIPTMPIKNASGRRRSISLLATFSPGELRAAATVTAAAAASWAWRCARAARATARCSWRSAGRSVGLQ